MGTRIMEEMMFNKNRIKKLEEDMRDNEQKFEALLEYLDLDWIYQNRIKINKNKSKKWKK